MQLAVATLVPNLPLVLAMIRWEEPHLRYRITCALPPAGTPISEPR
jgi:hypothetical protein